VENSNSHIPEDRHKRHGKARLLSKCLNHLVEPICKKQGFVNASVVLDWPQIVGQNFADLCQVIKVTFPFNSRRDGCLHVSTTSSMAAVLSYEESLILEKINRYYGYQAISKLKVFHGLRPTRKQLDKIDESKIDVPFISEIKGVTYEPLKTALANLSHHIQKSKKRV
jgi:hypothetical protein